MSLLELETYVIDGCATIHLRKSLYGSMESELKQC